MNIIQKSWPLVSILLPVKTSEGYSAVALARRRCGLRSEESGPFDDILPPLLQPLLQTPW